MILILIRWTNPVSPPSTKSEPVKRSQSGVDEGSSASSMFEKSWCVTTSTVTPRNGSDSLAQTTNHNCWKIYMWLAAREKYNDDLTHPFPCNRYDVIVIALGILGIALLDNVSVGDVHQVVIFGLGKVYWQSPTLVEHRQVGLMPVLWRKD